MLTIEFQHQGDDGDDWIVSRKDLKGRVLDLSEEGVSFFINCPTTTNQLFPFRIDTYDGSRIEGQGEVRWAKKKDSAKG